MTSLVTDDKRLAADWHGIPSPHLALIKDRIVLFSTRLSLLYIYHDTKVIPDNVRAGKKEEELLEIQLNNNQGKDIGEAGATGTARTIALHKIFGMDAIDADPGQNDGDHDCKITAMTFRNEATLEITLQTPIGNTLTLAFDLEMALVLSSTAKLFLFHQATSTTKG